MTNSGDAAEQIVRISLDGVEYAIKIAGAGAKNLAALLLAAIRSKKSKTTSLKITGHERLKRMLKSGRPLDVFSVREKDLRVFTQEAKKYGIVYCAIRGKRPKADGMVDVMVRKEDAPKINRVMELLEYGAVDKASIKSEIVKTKGEKGTEPSTGAGQAAPDKSDTFDFDSFFDSLFSDEGKSKQAENQAVQPAQNQPVKPVDRQKAAPEGTPDFFTDMRTKQNPSAHGLENTSGAEGTTLTDVNEYERSSYSNSHGEQVVNGSSRGVHPPSVKGEIEQIKAELKEKAESRTEKPQRRRGKSKTQQTTRHRQPPNTRKPKSKTTKER